MHSHTYIQLYIQRYIQNYKTNMKSYLLFSYLVYRGIHKQCGYNTATQWHSTVIKCMRLSIPTPTSTYITLHPHQHLYQSILYYKEHHGPFHIILCSTLRGHLTHHPKNSEWYSKIHQPKTGGSLIVKQICLPPCIQI